MLWKETSRERYQGSRLAGEVTADVAIIGAGYAGLSAALALAERGARVVVLEADEPGAGGSGRNAAGLAAMWAGVLPSDITRRFGAERGEAMNQLVAGSAGLVRELVEKHRIAADLVMNGMLIAAHKPAAEAGLRKMAEEWSTYGNVMDWVDRPHLEAMAATRNYGGGLMLRQAGTLNPFAYVQGLARAASESGAAVHPRSPVLAIEARGREWEVATAEGSVRAAQVLIAAGTGSGRLWPKLDRCFYRLPIAVVASEPLTAEAARMLLPGGVPLSDSNAANLFWIALDRERRVIGSLLPPVRQGKPAAAVAAPYGARLRRVFANLPPLRWASAWSGEVDLVPDRIPKLVRLAEGVHALFGFSGQGINAATAFGRAAASVVLNPGVDSAGLPVTKPEAIPLPRALPLTLRLGVFPALRLGQRLP